MKISMMDIENIVEVVGRLHQISSPAFTMNSSTAADLLRGKIATAKSKMPNIADKLINYPMVYNEFVPSQIIGFGDLDMLYRVFDESNYGLKPDLIAKVLIWMKVS